MAFLQPKHLPAGPEAEAEFWDYRGGMEPAAGRRRGHHVALAINNVEMHGVADHLAHAPDGRLARSHRRGRARVLRLDLDQRAESLDRARTQVERGFVGDQL